MKEIVSHYKKRIGGGILVVVIGLLGVGWWCVSQDEEWTVGVESFPSISAPKAHPLVVNQEGAEGIVEQSRKVLSAPLPMNAAQVGYEDLGAAISAARHAITEVDKKLGARPENQGVRYFAANPGQDLTARFLDGLVRIQSGVPGRDWKLALGLAGATAAPHRMDDDRITYDHGRGLVEYYVNRPEGLEHGFVLKTPLKPRSEGLVVGVSGDLHVIEDEESPGDLAFVDVEGTKVLGYQDLKVWDAKGQELEATMKPYGEGILLAFDDRHATYPVTIDPLVVSYESRLDAGDGTSDDWFGSSVSVDGDTAVVGAHRDDTAAGNDAGSAYTYVRSGTQWIQQDKLTAEDGAAGDHFGYSVSLDGDTVVVGAFGDGDNVGSVYIYVRNGADWTLQAKSTAEDGAAGDHFGYSVSLDGDTVVVGAFGDGDNVGSVYIYVRNGADWTLQAKWTADDGNAGDYFGYSVSIDGDTVVVGAPGDVGSAYVYVRNGANWMQQAKLTAVDGASGDNFGRSVSVAGDTVVVGASGDDLVPTLMAWGPAAPDVGSAYVYVRNGENWMQQAKLRANDGNAWYFFGSSVSVYGDTVVVGAPSNRSAYVYVRSGTIWNQEAQLMAADGPDYFGNSVSVDRGTVVVGAYGDDTAAGMNAGSAYVYHRSGMQWMQQAQLTAGDGASGDNFGRSVSVDGDTVVVGAYGDDTEAGVNAGSAYVFTRSGNLFWNLQGKLLASDGAANDNFGISVSVDGDTTAVGAYVDDTSAGTNAGSAYIYVRDESGWIQQAKLTANDGAAEDRFGRSVSVDGDTVLVGARGDEMSTGSAYVYVRSESSWSEQAKLAASDGDVNDQFGISVSVEADTAVVGAFLDDTGLGVNAGSAYVYVRSGTTWMMQAKLIASDGEADDLFGRSVSLSGDSLLIGARNDESGTGSAYFFERSGTTWNEQTKIVASDGAAGDRFGVSVSLSGDMAVVGAYFDDTSAGTDSGSAYLYARAGSGWSEQAKITAPDGAAGDEFGLSVALSDTTIVISASAGDTLAGADAGSASVFTTSLALEAAHERFAQITAPDGSAGDRFGIRVAAWGELALVGASWDMVGANAYQGSAHLVNLTDGASMHTLHASDGASGDEFGTAVALSPKYALVGAFLSTVNGNAGQGAVYVFDPLAGVQQRKLVAADGAAGDLFGAAAAISGHWGLVGAPRKSVSGDAERGAAYVYDLRDGSQVLQLLAPDGLANDRFGVAVAISGNVALVGAYQRTENGQTEQGAAYAFDVTTGTLLRKLTAPDGAAGDFFGLRVALDGNAALVGASGHDGEEGVNQGAAYLFDLATGSLRKKFQSPNGAASDFFGSSVSLSETHLLIGAYAAGESGGSAQGAAYLFDRQSDKFLTQYLASEGMNGDHFGISTALTKKCALVGAYSADINGAEDQGAAYAFDLTEFEVFAEDGAAGDQFGVSVAVAGEHILVGADYDRVNDQDYQGSVYVLNRLGEVQHRLTASDGMAGDQFGLRTELTADYALIGAFLSDPEGSPNQGAAYVFDPVDGSELRKVVATDGAAGDFFGSAVSVEGAHGLIGANSAAVGGAVKQGAAYLVDLSNGTQLHKFTAADGNAGDRLGVSTALVGNLAFVGAHLHDVNGETDQGAVYVYDTQTGNQLRKLTASDGAANDQFGVKVAVEGNHVLVSAWGHQSFRGAAYLFDVSNGMELRKFEAPDGVTNDYFGSAVALSGDLALIGAFVADVDGGTDQGAAYLFNVHTGEFLQKLTSFNRADADRFGVAVALDGATAVVGAYWDDALSLVDQGSISIVDVSSAIRDYGDAYDLFPVLASDGGASHGKSCLTLGLAWDSEADGRPSGAGVGDDTAGVDDEDGLIFPAPMKLGASQTIDVTVSGGDGYLNGWMDYNEDHDWDDPGEHIFQDQVVREGVSQITLTIPPSVTPGWKMLRFRLSTRAGLNPGGYAPDGEVEDYQVTVFHPYSIWMGLPGHFPGVYDSTITGPTANPDGDVHSNLGEFFLGLTPNLGQGNAAIEIGEEEVGGLVYQTLSYRRRKDAKHVTSEEVLRSMDLQSGWNSGETTIVRVSELDSETDWVTVRSIVPKIGHVPEQDQEYLKLRVEETVGGSGAVYTSEPSGFLRTGTSGNADTLIGLPLWRPALFTGSIEAVSGNTFTVLAGLADGELSSESNPFYVHIVSGILDGWCFTVTSNMGDTITVNPTGASSLEDRGLAIGDSIRITPHWTLGTCFPNGDGIIGSSSVFNPESTLKLYSPETPGINFAPTKTYLYHDGSQGPEGWYNNDSLSSGLQNDVVLSPGMFFILRNSRALATDFIHSGQVPTQRIGIVVGRFADGVSQDNILINPYPAPMMLGASGLHLLDEQVFEASSSVFNATDTLKLFVNPSGINPPPDKTYLYHDGSQGPAGWYDNDQLGSGRQNGVIIPPGGAMIVRKRAGSLGSAMWLPGLTYQL